MTFFAKEQRGLIAATLASTCPPDGVSIRTVDFERDLQAISNLPVDDDFDTISPAYGMVAEDCSDEITLIAVKNNTPVGQVSASIETADGPFVEIDLFLSGIFVSADERNKGIGSALGKALLDIMEAWRRAQATASSKSLEGGITVSGDTLPGSGGAAIEEIMQKYADQLAEGLEKEEP